MSPIELVFTKQDGLDISMDVFIPQNASETSQVPVLLWWHGERAHFDPRPCSLTSR